jgi:hypothetical protein
MANEEIVRVMILLLDRELEKTLGDYFHSRKKGEHNSSEGSIKQEVLRKRILRLREQRRQVRNSILPNGIREHLEGLYKRVSFN